MTRYYAPQPKEAGPAVTPPFPSSLLPERLENFWDEIWEYGKGVYTLSSKGAIIDYCRLVDLSDKAYEKIQINGFISEGSNGQEVISPEFKAYKEIQTMLTTARDRLGLSPRSAAEIGLSKLQQAQAISKLEAFKDKREQQKRKELHESN